MIPALIIAVLSVQPVSTENVRLLITPFRDLTGQETQWIGLAVQATLVSDLGSRRGVSVISEEDRIAALKEMEFQLTGLAQEEGQAKVGRLMGANVLLHGEYAVADGQIRFTARMTSVETGEVLNAVKSTGKLEDIFNVQDRLVADILKQFARDGSALEPRLDTAASAPPTPPRKLEFYEAFGKGLAEEQAGHRRAANAAFRQAHKIEPSNLEVVFKLAFNCLQIGEPVEADRLLAEALKRIKAEPTAAEPTAVSRIYFALGRLAYDRKDTEGELRWFLAASEALSAQPVDQWKAKVTVRLGEAYRHLSRNVKQGGDLGRALAMFEQARGQYEQLGLTRTLDYAQLLRSFGNYYMNMRDEADAETYFRKCMELLKALGQETSGGYADLLHSLAELNRTFRRRDAMLGYYKAAAALYDKLGMRSRAAEVRQKANETRR